jgi:cysteine desulfurase/selenocysteine lyase
MVEEIRKQFPALSAQVYGKPLVYLDNAATAMRPQSVVDTWSQSVLAGNANIHRAVHYLAGVATEAYEGARDCVQAFINASSREEIVFTSGATAAVNLVAFSFGEAFIGEGDEVIVSTAEHHSNIVPWQLLCERKKAVLKVLDIRENGTLAVEQLEKLLSQRTKIVAISHISNVLGLINPVRGIAQICHAHGVPVLVDGAQGIVHEPVDVQALDCDFYVFSGHKLYAATGTGVLYGKRKWLDSMPPYMGGGEMIKSVSFTKTTFAPLPEKFEAGTQNFNGAPTLVPAIRFVQEARANEAVQAEQAAITEYV